MASESGEESGDERRELELEGRAERQSQPIANGVWLRVDAAEERAGASCTEEIRSGGLQRRSNRARQIGCKEIR